MRKTLLTTFLLFFAVLTAECQCLINNGMSSYHGSALNGTNITVNDIVSGSDTMGSGCSIPPTTKHTAHASVTVSSAGNPLQNPNFVNGTAGWSWQTQSSGGWSLGYGGLPSPPGGLGYSGMFSGTGTAAVVNQKQIAVVPGNSVTV
jgi:hypothetical protein